MEVERAPDVAILVRAIVRKVPFDHVRVRRVICVRSHRAKTRARARIWSFPKIWQLALDTQSHYVIEVVSQHFDHMSPHDKIRVLIHELMHIPKNFSGALVPHRGLHHRINSRSVEHLFRLYNKSQ